jgi:hypothetical protein
MRQENEMVASQRRRARYDYEHVNVNGGEFP